jgi:hypothetical protein
MHIILQLNKLIEDLVPLEAVVEEVKLKEVKVAQDQFVEMDNQVDYFMEEMDILVAVEVEDIMAAAVQDIVVDIQQEVEDLHTMDIHK